MTTRAKLTLYSALACALTAVCLTPLLVSNGWLVHALLLIALTAATGAGLRRLSVPRLLVPAGQLLVLLYALTLGFVRGSLTGGLLPGPTALDALSTVLRQGVTDIQQYAIPAPASPGLRLILVGSVALIAILVDVVAVTFRQAALAGLPLLALYSVGTGLADEGSNAWLWFLLAACGYLLLLFAEGQDRLSRWGRVFHGGRGTDSRGGLSQGGRSVGLLALAAALVLPMVLGTWDVGLFRDGTGHGLGRGKGGGSGVTNLDPLVNLANSLVDASGTEVMTYTMQGDAAGTTYLRTSALDTFDGTEWKITPRDVVPNPGTLPDVEGLAPGSNGTRFTTAFAIGDDFRNAWLPMPYPAAEATPSGKWNFERSTRTLSGAGNQTTQGLKYEVTSLDLRPEAAELQATGPAPEAIAERYLDLPSGLPDVVAATAATVTKGKSNAYDKAVALQTWFTRTGGFEYSTAISQSTGNDAIAAFLRNKKGFCVHYAGTMAAMARTLGIPSRVAIGFTPGTATGPNTYQVTDRDYHAWPELYFQGAGWVRFEPTPGRGSVPDYSAPVTAPTKAPTQQPTTAAPSAAAVPTATPTSSCDAKQRADACSDRQKAAAPTAHESSWLLSWQVLGTAAGVIVLLGLLATPMLWRSRPRRRRPGTGGRRGPGGGPGGLSDQEVLAAWDELVDSAWDLGIPPDDSRTPRSAVRRISEAGELDEDATAAAGRVALATERVLYARGGGPAAPLAPDVRRAREGLRASARRTGRARAVLLPPSSAKLWWQATDRAQETRSAVGGGVSRAVGAVTAPVRRAWARLRPGPRP